MKHSQFKQLIDVEMNRLRELTSITTRSGSYGGLRDRYVSMLQKYILPLRSKQGQRPRVLKFLSLL